VSLRDLADEFNRRLVAAATEYAGMNAFDGEVDNYYRLLATEDAPPDARVDASRHLEHNGVDVEQLESDLVSYQAIRSYLKTFRDVEHSEAVRGDRFDRITESIKWLQSRLEAVSRTNLGQLR